MTAVVENIRNTQGVQEKIVPLPPLKMEVVARTLGELVRPLQNDPQELLKSRFLCRGGGLLVVGPTGIGKSSLSMQMMINWALGKRAFDIEPARPLKSLLIQAENDDGDLAEMRDGVFSGLNLSDEDKEEACEQIYVVQENSRVNEAFFEEVVRPLLQQIKPDLLWIDPALSFLGGENNSQKDVGSFLRNQLNPLLVEFQCAAIVIHHTNKPYAGPERRGGFDDAYLGGGSAEWANWSRAIMTLKKTDAPTIFELRAAKRGSRIGWKEADGTTPAYSRFLGYSKEPGTICWVDVDPSLVEDLGTGRSDEVLKHVPLNRPIAKNALIDICSKSGVGKNLARRVIDGLVEDGDLFVWMKARSGSQPEKHLARIPQPLDAQGKEMFTEIFTAILAHEHLCENQTRDLHTFTPPLGGVKNDREHLEGRDSSLPVPESKRCEDLPPVPILPPLDEPNPHLPLSRQ